MKERLDMILRWAIFGLAIFCLVTPFLLNSGLLSGGSPSNYTLINALTTIEVKVLALLIFLRYILSGKFL